MSDVEIDDVFCISSLNTDGERLVRMECEGDKSSGGRRRVATQQSSADPELEQPRITRVKPATRVFLTHGTLVSLHSKFGLVLSARRRRNGWTQIGLIPDWVVATCLWTFHYGHPLVIVAEEGQVEIRTAAVRLRRDGQLCQESLHCFSVSC